MPKISDLAQKIKELTEQLLKEVKSNGNTGINKETGK